MAMSDSRAIPPAPPTETRRGARVPVPEPHGAVAVPLALRPGTPRFLQLALLSPSPQAPCGRILPAIGGVIHEEAVPREVVAAFRKYVLARGTDGSSLAWSRYRR
jgi:hypothetical protein